MSEQKEKKDGGFLKALAYTAGGALGGKYLRGGLSIGMLAIPKHPQKDHKDFLRKANKHHKTKVDIRYSSPHQLESHLRMTKKRGAKNSDWKYTIHTSRTPHEGIFAHEWGHAKSNKNKPLPLKLLRRLSHRTYKPLGLLASAGLASSDNEIANKAAPYATGIIALPTLTEEAAATYHGTKELIRQRGMKRGLKSLLATAPAFASYLAAPVASYFATKKYLENEKKK